MINIVAITDTFFLDGIGLWLIIPVAILLAFTWKKVAGRNKFGSISGLFLIGLCIFIADNVALMDGTTFIGLAITFITGLLLTVP